jgi:hypothetical protein
LQRNLPKAAADAFIAAGYMPEQVFEILLGIAAKMLANFFNEIADTPLEPGLEPYAWSPPRDEHDLAGVTLVGQTLDRCVERINFMQKCHVEW